RLFQVQQRRKDDGSLFSVLRSPREGGTENREQRTENDSMAQEKVGKVIQVIGPAIDIEFEEGHLPSIYNAVRIVDNGELGQIPIDVVVEVANHIGENQVRCIAMKPTDGMVRGMKATDLGEPITVPVGNETLGRILNVLGEPVDNLGAVNAKERWSIHREPPPFEDQSTEIEIFETGIKVVDLLE